MVKFLQTRSTAIFVLAIATSLPGCALLTAEPVNVALGMFGAAFALLQLGRNPRVRKWIVEVAHR